MAKWYNYFGLFSSQDYYEFLSIYELNPWITTKIGLKHLIKEHFESYKVDMMIELMIKKAIYLGDIIKTDEGYMYNGPRFVSV